MTLRDATVVSVKSVAALPAQGVKYSSESIGLRFSIWIAQGIALLLSLPIAVALRLLAPWRRVRIGLLGVNRIGHLAANTEIFLRSRVLGLEDQDACYLVLCGPPANRQLMIMIRRQLCVLEFGWLYPFVRFYFNNGLKIVLARQHLAPFKIKNNEYNQFNNAPPQLSFLQIEEARGRRLLESMGIPPGAQFICFHARDKEYLERAVAERPPQGWSHHDHRDCDIRNYLPAAEALAALGFYTLRMGHIVEKPLITRNSKIIDYANKYRSDFGDIYLLARCRFILGNSAGPVPVASCFNVPVAVANDTPLGNARWRRADIFIPKKYRNLSTGIFIPFPEIIALGADLWAHNQRFVEAGIELVENTPEEILALALEMHGRLEGSWHDASGDQELQDRYRSMFPVGHHIEGYPSRVGAEFLRQNAGLLG